MKKILCSLCSMLLASTLFMAVPVSAREPWEVRNVAYDDIEELVDDCVDFSGSSSQLDTLLSQMQESKNAVGLYVNTLTGQLAGLTPGTAEYQSVSGQLSVASATLIQLNATMVSANQSLEQLDSARDQLVIGAKTLYITYNSLSNQTAELRRSQTVFNENLRAMEKQYELGMITKLTLDTTRASGENIRLGIQTMELQLSNLKRSFNTLLGRSYSQGLTLKNIPYSKLNKIDDINFKDDLEVALSNSPDSSTGMYNNPDYDEEKGSFAASFRTLYDTINDKQAALDNAKVLLALEEQNYAASEKQHDLGLISELGMVSAKDKLDTQKAAVESAQVALFTAYEQYQWAKEFGIISGN